MILTQIIPSEISHTQRAYILDDSIYPKLKNGQKNLSPRCENRDDLWGVDGIDEEGVGRRSGGQSWSLSVSEWC